MQENKNNSKRPKVDHDLLYSRGVIAPWYLRDSQIELYKMLQDKKKTVARCHRRYGKGTTVFVYIFERCLKERITVRYGTDTQLHAHSIFEYLRDKIFEKCPQYKPKKKGNYYEFPLTGSRIYIFGVKDSSEADKARGEEAHIIVCDEYGFWKFRASYVLKSVLAPQLLETNGQMIIVSTPPEDMTHDYVNQVVQADLGDYLFHWDIDDSMRVGERSEADHVRIIEDCGVEGKESAAYKREYLCEMIASPERLVVPEAQDEELYVAIRPRPTHFDYYVCMDLGLRDHTAVLFAYPDFLSAVLVVEDEYVTNYTATSEIVNQCRIKEKELGIAKTHRRIGDCEMQQLFDMSRDHDYQVTPITKRTRQTGKGFADSVINQVRIGVQVGKIIINPKCVNLITQLKYGIWNERRTDFERTESMGHLDALMALAYLYDNIDWQRNPYPKKFADLDRYNSHFNEAAKKKLGKGNGLEGLIRKV